MWVLLFQTFALSVVERLRDFLIGCPEWFAVSGQVAALQSGLGLLMVRMVADRPGAARLRVWMPRFDD